MSYQEEKTSFLTTGCFRIMKKFCFYLIIMTVVMIIFSYLFSDSQGLLYVMDNSKETKIKYVSELLSSGSNDNMLVGLYDWFYLPLIIYYIYNKCRMTKFILSAYFFILILQLLSFLLLDVGSIAKTIIYGQNLTLFIWLISYIVIIIFILYALFNYKNLSKK